jgi:hypothetical protein
MPGEKDPLAGEVSVSAKVDETGLTARAKSRAVVALDRLIGSVVDIPAAWLETRAHRIRQQDQVRDQLVEAHAQAAVVRLKQLPDVGEHTLKLFLKDQKRKQLNRDSIAFLTMEELSLPPPRPLGPAAQGEGTMQDGDISEDWLNLYSAHAENASSEHLRSLWAKILAGEIRRPGAFSRTTLRAVSELDREIAAMFQSKVIDRLQGRMILKPKDLKRQELMDLSFLEEVGLLQQVNGMINLTLAPVPDGNVYLPNGRSLLRIKSGAFIQVPIILITRVGREIASILPTEADEAPLRKVAQTLRQEGRVIELCKIDDAGNLSVVEML